MNSNQDVAVVLSNYKAKLMLRQNLKNNLGLERCPVVRCAEDIARIFSDIANYDYEVIIAGAVDCKCRLIYWSMLAMGSSDRLVMRIGDAFHGVIQEQGSAIFLAHNHPSGSLKPSSADFELTRSVAEAGMLIGYPLIDHVVISRKGSRSIMKASVLKNQHAARLTTAEVNEARENVAHRTRWVCAQCGIQNEDQSSSAVSTHDSDLCRPARCSRCREFTWLADPV